MRIVTDRPVVTLSAVSHHYDGRAALDAVSLAVAAGEHVALLGPNGSGKSTLLSLICGVQRPSAGTVSCPPEVAFVVQRSAVPDRLPITVRDAVAMGRWASRGFGRPLRREDRVIVEDAMGRMGLQDLGGRRFAELSGGQRQRTLIAQALAQQAPVLLLDEPEAGLDISSRTAITTVLAEEAARGTALIIATHDTRTASHATRCVLLREGRIVADGVPEVVLTGVPYAEAFLTATPDH